MNATHHFCLLACLLAPGRLDDSLATGPQEAAAPLAQDRGAAHAITFSPSPGAELAKTFERRIALARASHTVVVGGTESRGLDATYEVDETLRLEVADTYVESGAGRHEVLERRYVAALSNYEERQSGDLVEGLQRVQIEAKSGLIGRTVVFRRESPDAEAVPEFAADSPADSPELLEDLLVDTDLTGFLPRGPVTPGTSWSVPVARLRNVLAPGGDLHLEAQDEELPRGLSTGARTDFSAWLDDVEGKIIATFEGLDERSGLARIALEVSVTSEQDQTERARALASELAGDLGEGEEVEFDFLEISLALEAAGALVWDTRSGLPHSVDLEGTLGIVIDTGMTVTVEDERLEIEESSELAGTLGLTLSTTGP